MPLFDTPAVKALKKEASQVGVWHGMACAGEISTDDVSDAVGNEGLQKSLKDAFDAAARDVGADKALRKAIKVARGYAEVWGHEGNDPFGASEEAERSIRAMLHDSNLNAR